jgi:signal peptidase I
MKFFIPNPGDTVRVRLHTGEVVDAKYVGHYCEKIHRVRIEINGERGYSINTFKYASYNTVRFIGPSCDLVPS